MQWDRALLQQMLELAAQVEPAVEVRWDVQHFITLRVPGVKPLVGAVADEAGRRG